MLKQLSGSVLIFLCVLEIQSCVGQKAISNQNKFTADTLSNNILDGVWKLQKSASSINVECDEVEFIFKGSQLFYRANNDTFFYWAVIRLNDSVKVNYIYQPRSVDIDRYRIKYSNEFIRKYYYLNDHNVSPYSNPCLIEVNSFINDVNQYEMKNDNLIFRDTRAKKIVLKRQ